jgi:hypothetical protein
VHDVLGHFRADKTYASLRDDYYWPNMRRDLEKAYLLGCEECQRNKSPTRKPKGPLHPLSIPDKRGDSVAMDFIGPLLSDKGYDCIVTFTDRLGGTDVRLEPTRCDISAEELASIFFDSWYCENGLPLEIISDHDKLFISKFWKALHVLTGVKPKMSTSYHPETDGASERTNKTVIQSIRYHVERNQRGWVKALPRIQFAMMNTVNASTGYSGFQLRMGRSPRIIPPIVPTRVLEEWKFEGEAAINLLRSIDNDVAEAKDNLLRAKAIQAFNANRHHGKEDIYKIGDRVMLSTMNRRRDYKNKDEKRVAKFFLRWDGPYEVIKLHPEKSDYTLKMPASRVFNTFHASELKRYRENDKELFPSQEYKRPGPIMTDDGVEEYLIDRIIDERKKGKGPQYLVRWDGYGPEHDTWLSSSTLDECEALERWLSKVRLETQ